MRIEPLMPLLVRDGRPFSAAPGARARTLPFPLPQTLAGVLRYRVGLAQGLRFPEEAERVRDWTLRGPLLLEEGAEGWGFLFPLPLDALSVGGTLHRLVPLRLPQGVKTNLPEGLLPVGPSGVVKGKPDELPRFWYKEAFWAWLLGEDPGPKGALGHGGPVLEVRVHVALEGGKGTAREGALFQTSGLGFFRKEGGALKRLALWAELSQGEVRGIFPLGGERRLALFGEGPPLPPPPEGLLEGIKARRAARVVFLTPAYFQGGFWPEGGRIQGARVRAVALGRPLVASGWDLKEGRPKPTRRLVPPGSVYFVSLEGEDPEAWFQRVWFQNLSEGGADREGYGLMAVGLWDGEPVEWREHAEGA